jgi:hypothetical protein
MQHPPEWQYWQGSLPYFYSTGFRRNARIPLDSGRNGGGSAKTSLLALNSAAGLYKKRLPSGTKFGRFIAQTSAGSGTKFGCLLVQKAAAFWYKFRPVYCPNIGRFWH